MGQYARHAGFSRKCLGVVFRVWLADTGFRFRFLDDWSLVMDIRSGQISGDVRGVVDYSESALLGFWFEGEAKCESAHSESECSGLVVGVKRVLCSGDVFRVCRSSFEWNLAMIANPGFVCSGCGLPCGVCWRVVLV